MPSTIAPSASDDAGFAFPSWSAHVALEPYLNDCPASATTRGTFFTNVIDHVRRQTGRDPDELYEGLTARRWQAFNTYSLRDFMRLAHNAARLAYWNHSLSDGLRRIGWMSYPSLASTMAGRAVLFALGDDLEGVVEASPKAYSIGLPLATVGVHRLGERHFRYELREVHSFVDTYHYGVLEGAILAFRFQPSIRVRRLPRTCDADFDVRWR